MPIQAFHYAHLHLDDLIETENSSAERDDTGNGYFLGAVDLHSEVETGHGHKLGQRLIHMVAGEIAIKKGHCNEHEVSVHVAEGDGQRKGDKSVRRVMGQ